MASFRRKSTSPGGGPNGGDGIGRQRRIRCRLQHQHADRLSLFPQFLAQRAKTAAPLIVTARAAKTSVAHAGGHGRHRLGQRRVIADLDVNGKSVVIAKGGAAVGNIHKSSTNRARARAPRASGRGTDQARTPRARRCRPARVAECRKAPSSAPSPLRARRSPTTCSPPCTRIWAWCVDENKSFVIADVPGLIEGAAEGAGLASASSSTSPLRRCCTSSTRRRWTLKRPGARRAPSSASWKIQP